MSKVPVPTTPRGNNIVTRMIARAEQVLSAIRNEHLATLEAREIDYGHGFQPHNARKVSSYRLPEGIDGLSPGSVLAVRVAHLLPSSPGVTTVFCLVSDGGGVSVSYATAVPPEHFIPDADVLDVGFAQPACTAHAIVLGEPSGPIDYDAVIDGMAGRPFALYAVCEPCDSSAMVSQVSSIREAFKPYEQMQVVRPGGSTTVPVPAVGALLAELDAYEAELRSRPIRHYLTFRCSARCAYDLDLLTNLVRSNLNAQTGTLHHRILTLATDEGGCSIPRHKGTRLAYDTPNAALAFVPPMRSHRGIRVAQQVKDGSEQKLFAGVPLAECGITVGECGGQPVRIPLDRLPEHVMIAGASGTGKSKMMEAIAVGLHEKGIGFIGIEPAKREMAESFIGSGISTLDVYGDGLRGRVAPLNVMQVPAGSSVGAHARDMADALAIAIGALEEPLPQVLLLVIRAAYEAIGWKMSDIARNDRHRRWPTLRDVENHIDCVVDSMGYEPRVCGNVKAALHARIGAMLATSGDALCPKNAIGIESLVAGESVFELADMSDAVASFLALGLLVVIKEHARSYGRYRGFRLAVLIDELHAVTDSDSAVTPIANRLIESCARELRSSGIALVTAGQMMSRMPDAIKANCASIFAFRARTGSDQEAAANAMSLVDAQKRALGDLGVGECVCTVPGASDALLITTTRRPDRVVSAQQAACIMCGHRVVCRKAHVANALRGVGCERARSWAKSLDKIAYEPDRLGDLAANIEGAVGLGAKDRACLIGLIMEVGGLCFERARVICAGVLREGGHA